MTRLTEEQQKIIDTTPDNQGVLKVVAFAGTGKTFTLGKYAEARPQERFLYAAFNKSIQLEAERKMPSNVTSRTCHSLAYRAFATPYQQAGLLRGNMPLWQVQKFLGVDTVMANFALSVVLSFMSSDSLDITEDHYDYELRSYYARAIEQDKCPPFVDMAKAIWADMKSKDPRSLPITHDAYLKMFQLSGPVIDTDCILLDEAQDTTPCVWDIFKHQRARKIVVGDPHQAIYGWRGAIDALDLVDDDSVCYLSKSFRFGPKLAQLASTLLRVRKGERKELQGFEELNTQIYSTASIPSNRVTLCRSNIEIFDLVAEVCQSTNKNIGFVGGDHKNYRFPTILDVYHVYNDQPERAKDPLIKALGDFTDLSEYAESTNNGPLKSMIKVVEQYTGQVPRILSEVQARDVGEKYGEAVYATGHKSKGREFPTVLLGDDFARRVEQHNLYPDEGIMTDEEVNLLYVAITRATESLHVPPVVKDFMLGRS